MFVLSGVLVTLALTTAAVAQSGFPQYIFGEWIVTEETPLREELDGSEKSVDVEEQWLTTLPPPSIMEDQGVGVSPVWLVFLVVPLVLLTAMGALAVGYYLCVWRGGRMGYRKSRDLLSHT